MKEQLREFVEAVSEAREPSVSGWDARMAVAMVKAAEESSETGASVGVPR